MSSQQPRYSVEETAQRGDAIYEHTIRPLVEVEHHGKVVAIDVETGAYAIDNNALAAARRLRQQQPEAEIWFVRVGHRALYRIGIRPVLDNA